MPKNLGTIKKVHLRDVFTNEASEFTPWLEKNINKLSEIMGIEIEEVQKEKGVGDFNADLIGVEANSGDKIIIENQIEQTDHDHLGKLITYASGVEAKYVIWIAKKIREEHQKALEWLNENTRNNLSFFGVEIEAISIDDSKPALNFKLVIEPNTWGREVKQSIEQIDERHKKYLQFYTRLISEYEKIKPEWSHLTPRPDSWLGFGAGKAGFNFNWSFRSNNKFNVELYIDTKDKDEIKMYFNELKKFSEIIDKKITGLLWEELPDKRASRIAIYYQMPTAAKNMDDKQMDDLISWAIEKMDLFKKIFPEYIQKLNN
jgi:hypothetical protein